MASQGRARFGPQCPYGHGALLTGDSWTRLYCPHSDHGGNGRFFTAEEAMKELTPEERRLIVRDTEEAIGKIAAQRAAAKSAQAPRPAPAAPRAIVEGTGPECLCGCGERTKGGRFRPGHDARYHAAQKKAGAH